MNYRRGEVFLPTVLIIVFVIALDQLSKAIPVALGFPYHAGNLYHPTVTTLVIAAGVLGLLKHPSSGLVLIVSGGVSNLLDLVIKNEVQDIFVVKNFAFNLADIFIVAGFSLIFLGYLRNQSKKLN